MNKYFDNILFFLQRSGGGSVYWGELIKRFEQGPNVNFIQPNIPSSNIVLKNLKLGPVIKERNIPLKILRYLPVTCTIEEEALFHSSYYRYCGQRGVKNVVTVHDFIYEYFRKGVSKLVHTTQKGYAVKKADGIICISHNTKRDLLTYFPHLVKGKQIEVIYNGVSEDFTFIQEKEPLYNKYSSFQSIKQILYLGHRTKYKNFDFAIDVVKQLPNDYKLAIVGAPLSPNEIRCLNNEIPNRFIFWGNVNNIELNELYNIADCLIYPSSYEGFGIPVLEAFRCKCPVIAQNIPAIKEIAGEGALLIDGLDINKFKKSILSLNSESIRKYQVDIGTNKVGKYSWDRCFSDVNDFYNIIKKN